MADKAAAEREEGFVDVAAAVVADEQSFELVQPGEGALDDPAVAAEAGAVAGAAACDLGFDSALAKLAPVLVVVVAAVGADAIGSPFGPADFAAHGRDPIDQRDQLGDGISASLSSNGHLNLRLAHHPGER